jgi:hypothetical protein
LDRNVLFQKGHKFQSSRLFSHSLGLGNKSHTKLGLPLQSILKGVMDLFAPIHPHPGAACLSQQSLTDEAIRDLTFGPPPPQNWIAGAGKDPVE